jgi:hypothetical protein
MEKLFKTIKIQHYDFIINKNSIRYHKIITKV